MNEAQMWMESSGWLMWTFWDQSVSYWGRLYPGLPLLSLQVPKGSIKQAALHCTGNTCVLEAHSNLQQCLSRVSSKAAWRQNLSLKFPLGNSTSMASELCQEEVASPCLCAERVQTLWGQCCSSIEKKSKSLKLVLKDPDTSQSWICGRYTYGLNKIVSTTFSLLLCKPLSWMALYEEMRTRSVTHNYGQVGEVAWIKHLVCCWHC